MMASYADWGHTAPTRLTKSRSKPAVKPILKKKGTQSAKSSLDLDRSWEEQIHFGSHGWGGSRGAGGGGSSNKGPVASPATGALESAVGWGDGDAEGSAYGSRDVSFSLPARDFEGVGNGSCSIGGEVGGGGSGGANGRSNYSHARSTSGASHASIATSGSGHGSYRTGSTFVHPFQQTPRTATPPLSVTNCLTFDPPAQQHQQSSARDYEYSPTITEDEDLEIDPTYSSYSHSRNDSYQALSLPSQSILASQLGANNSTTFTSNNSNNNSSSASSTNGPRRPSLASNRTSSLSDVNPAHRVNTNRSASLSGTSRLAHVHSTSDLNLLTQSNDSAASSSVAFGTSTPGNAAPISTSFNVSSPMSPSVISPLRTSFEGFRLRSRSDIDPGYHAERIRQERQKWQEKERLKALKREKEALKRRDRADSKEAEVLAKKEQKEAAARKKSGSTASASASASAETAARHVNAGSPKFSAGYISGTSYSGDSFERAKAAKTQSLRARLQDRGTPEADDAVDVEKMGFVSHKYDSTDPGHTPAGTSFDLPRRTTSAKRKTQGAWTTFVLWFRSRVLRLQTKLEK